ncbi:hypothetical protein HMPREF3212_01090 [Citrobacter freundii]|nr:hypothetical protein HMPREF3212_01090 [Citrobacter freundii]
MHQFNHFPFLKADEIPDFLRALEAYSGSKLVQIATKLLKITGVRTIELRAALCKNLIWITLFGKFLLKE